MTFNILKVKLFISLLLPLMGLGQNLIIDVSEVPTKHIIEKLEIDNFFYNLNEDTTHIKIKNSWLIEKSVSVKIFVNKKKYSGSFSFSKSYCPDENITILFMEKKRKKYYFQEHFCTHKVILGELSAFR